MSLFSARDEWGWLHPSQRGGPARSIASHSRTPSTPHLIINPLAELLQVQC